nr:exopolysaccharide biosynthesis polyprenyl glycosylphosphotransferase [Ligilactobacillus ruminis]
MSNKSMQALPIRFAKLMNVILIAIVFSYTWFNFYKGQMAEPFHFLGNWVLVFLFAVLYYSYVRMYDGFLVSISKISELVYSQVLAFLLSDAIIYVVMVILLRNIPNVFPLIGCALVQFIISVIWCLLVHKLYFKNVEVKNTVIVYDNEPDLEDVLSDYGLQGRFCVKKSIHIDEFNNDMNCIKDAQVVFLASIHSHERNQIIKFCVANDIEVFILPRIGDVIMSGAKRVHMLHLPVMKLERYNPKFEFLLIKRLFDIIVSGVALIILSPVMLIVAVIIKLTDGGPIFYKQVRLTKNAREFNVLKFRSMRVDAEKDGIARLSTGAKDIRVTPIGRFIRKVRIDELPQLINIIKGDMSIVGPRPERPQIMEQYAEELPEFKLRLQAKAGLTGYAQVYGKYNTTPYNKLEMDLMYIAKPSLLEDLKIMFATVKILFIPESTEGVSEGQATAMSNEKGR